MSAPLVSQLLSDAQRHETEGRIAQAEAVYRQIITVDGRHAEAWHALGQIAVRRGNDDGAAAFFGKAVQFREHEPQYRLALGATLERQGRLPEAVACIRQVIALTPDLAEAHATLGRIYGRMGDLETAAASLTQAVALDPKDTIAWYNLGLAQERQCKLEDALASYGQARALEPQRPATLNSIGTTLFAMKRVDEALAALDQALALQPNYADAWNNRATALLQTHCLEEALAGFDRVLGLNPGHVPALVNRGTTLLRLKHADQALASFARAQALAPNVPDAHWAESTARLALGDFERGWAKYEWRWRLHPELARNFHTPLWLGQEDLTGKSILLHAEQGFGDTIQFARYVPLVAARGARVVFEVPPMMKRLMASVAGWADLYVHGDTLPQTDFQCPLLSLPLALGTRVEAVPAQVPYVAVPDDVAARWRERLAHTGRPRVGIAWSGRFEKMGELHRAIPPEQLAPLLDCGATLVSLQKDYRAEDRAWLARHPEVLDFSADYDDFVDTAAVAREMDLVITIDTAAAHLAGALGLPTRVLLSYMADWRWMLEREDSPWYPTAKLYRQTTINDWTDVIARAVEEVKAL